MKMPKRNLKMDDGIGMVKKNKSRPSYVGGVHDKRPYAERTEIFPIKRKNIPNRTHEKSINAAYDRRSDSIGPTP